MVFIYIFFTVVLMTFSQILMKWRMDFLSSVITEGTNVFYYYFKLFLDPFIIIGFAAAFLSSLFWLKVLARLPLSYAYPFMGLTFCSVLIFSCLLFDETLDFYKVSGVALICFGIYVVSRSS